MKILIQFIATMVGSAILQYFLPWWTMAIAACAAGYFTGNKTHVAFLAGFLGIAMLWGGVAISLDLATQSILTEKVSKLLPVNPFLLTSLIGGLVGGFAAMTGALLKPKA